jgi:hypothetical protein
VPLAFNDPSADGDNNAWTKSSGTAGWSLLDDAVRSPDNARTVGDGGFITGLTDGLLQDIVFNNNIVYVAGSSYGLYIFGSGGDNRRVQVRHSYNDGGSWTGSGTAICELPTCIAGWYLSPISFSGITGQSQLDGFRARLEVVDSFGAGQDSEVQVDAVYLVQGSPQSPCPGDRFARYERCRGGEGWFTEQRPTRSFNPVTGYNPAL